MDKFMKKSRLFLLVLLALLLISALSIKIVWGWTAPNGNPPTGSNNNAIFYYNGKIGVGTSTPAYPLSASGTIYSSVGFRFPDGTTQTTAFSGISQTITAGNVSSGAFGSNTGGGNYSFPASLSVGTSTAPTGGVAFFNGNVGIGTASPDNKFHVVGDGIRVGYHENSSGYISGLWSATDGYRFNIIGSTYYDGSNFITNSNASFGSNYVSSIGLEANRGIVFYTQGSIGNTQRTDTAATFDGYERMRINASGNIGIGTTSPTYNLDISGTFRASATSTFNGNVGIGTASPARKLDVSTAGQITFGDNVADDDTSGIYWHSSSNYGIYRTAGAWTASTYQQLKMQFSTGIQLGAGTGVGTGYDKSYVEVVSGKGLMVTSGNVGIATTTPAYPLTVAGTIYSSTGGVRFPDGTTQTTAFLGGSSQTITAANVSSGNFGANTGGGNYSFPASLSVGTSTAPTGGVAFFNGNVGIGTASPTNKLDVRAISYANNQNGGIQIGSTNGYWLSGFKLKSDAGGVVRTAIDSTDGTINGTTREAISINTSGNVGIGMTSPSYPLDVTGSMRSSGEIISTNANQARFISGNYGVIHRNDGANYYILLTSSTDQYGTWNTLRPFIINNSTGAVAMNNGVNMASTLTLTGTAANIALGSNYLSGDGGDEGIVVNSTGYVGIATTTPAYPLTVAGTIYSSTGGVRFPDGTTQTTAFLGGSSQTITAANISSGNFGANTGGGNYSFPASLSIGTSTAPTGGVAFFNGNVGIGTASPTYKLDISGTFRASATSTFNGNVGIGTTNPAVKLDVVGNGNFTGGISTDGTNFIKTKIIDIGDWNMDASATPVNYPLSTGITRDKIRSFEVFIRTDSDESPNLGLHNFLIPNSYPGALGFGGYSHIHELGEVILMRPIGSYFDSTRFDSTGFNRGWVTINYIP